MIGIKSIGSYLPDTRVNNFDRRDDFSLTESFISDKIGMERLARNNNLSVADMCCRAFEDLAQRTKISIADVDCIVLCTQNGDRTLPHTSTYIQSQLDAPKECAVFDISLGCSGYVYGLSLIKSFMKENELSCGLFFTCDPYSSLLDHTDKNTELLFGDGATATLLTTDPIFTIQKSVFFNDGDTAGALMVNGNGNLYMDGRAVFNFVMRHAPGNITNCLNVNNISKDDVDLFLLHQGSKFIVQGLAKRLNLNFNKTPFKCSEYGNTISSSIPFMLQDYITGSSSTLLLSGFGVGLSVASTILRRVN